DMKPPIKPKIRVPKAGQPRPRPPGTETTTIPLSEIGRPSMEAFLRGLRGGTVNRRAVLVSAGVAMLVVVAVSWLGPKKKDANFPQIPEHKISPERYHAAPPPRRIADPGQGEVEPPIVVKPNALLHFRAPAGCSLILGGQLRGRASSLDNIPLVVSPGQPIGVAVSCEDLRVLRCALYMDPDDDKTLEVTDENFPSKHDRIFADCALWLK
ncbi:MAG TPA: hypothetical protein PK156_48655, partial [Polyangium sp.]|nr:hypothetical protein [Polyangium sp.]